MPNSGALTHTYHNERGCGDGKPHDVQYGEVRVSVARAEGLPCSGAGWEAAGGGQPGGEGSRQVEHEPMARVHGEEGRPQPGSRQEKHRQRLWDSVVSLHSALVRLHQFGAPQFKRGVGKLVRV